MKVSKVLSDLRLVKFIHSFNVVVERIPKIVCIVWWVCECASVSVCVWECVLWTATYHHQCSLVVLRLQEIKLKVRHTYPQDTQRNTNNALSHAHTHIHTHLHSCTTLQYVLPTILVFSFSFFFNRLYWTYSACHSGTMPFTICRPNFIVAGVGYSFLFVRGFTNAHMNRLAQCVSATEKLLRNWVIACGVQLYWRHNLAIALVRFFTKFAGPTKKRFAKKQEKSGCRTEKKPNAQ